MGRQRGGQQNDSTHIQSNLLEQSEPGVKLAPEVQSNATPWGQIYGTGFRQGYRPLTARRADARGRYSREARLCEQRSCHTCARTLGRITGRSHSQRLGRLGVGWGGVAVTRLSFTQLTFVSPVSCFVPTSMIATNIALQLRFMLMNVILNAYSSDLPTVFVQLTALIYNFSQLVKPKLP